MDTQLNTNSVTDNNPDAGPLLDVFEVRVLAVLAEKEALTPDNYPLSVNALVNACNQLSSRDPVMSISESTVQDILQRLMQRKFVAEVRQAGARVSKYEHRLRMIWLLEQDKLAILTQLMLRGIQTAGEIRSRCVRQHDFSSITEVESGLQFLIDKYPPLVACLPKAPGTKESRYVHLLSGDDVLTRQETTASFVGSANIESSRHDRIGQLEEEVVRLHREVACLTEQFETFRKQFD